MLIELEKVNAVFVFAIFSSKWYLTWCIIIWVCKWFQHTITSTNNFIVYFICVIISYKWHHRFYTVYRKMSSNYWYFEICFAIFFLYYKVIKRIFIGIFLNSFDKSIYEMTTDVRSKIFYTKSYLNRKIHLICKSSQTQCSSNLKLTYYFLPKRL